jgi:hypothetical protein
MDKILSYELKQLSSQVVMMPLNARTLAVQDAYGTPTLYAITDDTQTGTWPHVFHMIRTGMPFTWRSDWQYIATYQVPGYQVAWHIFERLVSPAREIIDNIVEEKIEAKLETAIEVVTDPVSGGPVKSV